MVKSIHVSEACHNDGKALTVPRVRSLAQHIAGSPCNEGNFVSSSWTARLHTLKKASDVLDRLVVVVRSR